MVQKNINVETNDENKRNFVLTLKANLITFLEIRPEYLNINIIKGEEGRTSANIISTRYPDFKILKVSIDNPAIKYEIANPPDEISKKEKGYTLTIITPPSMEPNTYNGKITIMTDIKEQPEAEFFYNININDIITVSPPNIALNVYNRILKVVAMEDIPVYENPSLQSPTAGILLKGKEAFFEDMEGEFARVRFDLDKRGYIKLEKTKKTYSGSVMNVAVQKHKNGNFEVTKVESDLPFLKIEDKKIQDNYYLITLNYEGSIEKANYNGTLTIYTNDKERPIITKPVQINVGLASPMINQGPRSMPFGKNMEIKNIPKKLEEKNEKIN